MTAIRPYGSRLVLFAGAMAILGQVPVGGEEAEFQLHEALRTKRYDAALRLIRIGEDVNEPDGSAAMPLCLATLNTESDAYDVTQALLRYGADTEVACDTGGTPLYNAALSGNLPVVELLANFGAELGASLNDDGMLTPLYGAYASGDARVVEFLELRGERITDEAKHAMSSFPRGKSYIDAELDAIPREGLSQAEREQRGWEARWKAMARMADDATNEVERQLLRLMAEKLLAIPYSSKPTGMSHEEWSQPLIDKALAEAQDELATR